MTDDKPDPCSFICSAQSAESTDVWWDQAPAQAFVCSLNMLLLMTEHTSDSLMYLHQVSEKLQCINLLKLPMKIVTKMRQQQRGVGCKFGLTHLFCTIFALIVFIALCIFSKRHFFCRAEDFFFLAGN